MLKKDEYNQEDYNDYYRQETEGAELNGPDDEDGGGAINKFIILLILIALAVAGYFGFKMMNSPTTDSIDQSLQVSVDTLPKTTQQETEEVIATPAQTTQKEVTKVADVTAEKTTEKVEQADETEKETVKDDVTNKVQQAVASSTKMSPEEVASIVAAVMQQMNQEKTTTPDNSVAAKKDVKLIHELSNSDVDSVSSDLEKELEGVNINENTQIDNSKKQVDVYNKVNVQNVKGEDTLSQLSAQITNEIEDAKVSSTTTTTTNEEDKEYNADIKKEVVFREKEMRIIIVKKGDTLGKLAKRAYGNVMDYKRIYKANPEITRPDRIYIGQKIRIPN